MAEDTADIRTRLESLSADEFASGGPLHYLANFIFSSQRYQFASIEDGANNLGAFVNKRWRGGREQLWGPEAGRLSPNRTCLTTQCLEASIDEWFNGTNGAGYMFDVDTVVNVHAALFSSLDVTGSTGDNLASRFGQQLSDSFDRMADPPPLSGLKSREDAYFYLYLIPICVLGVGLLGALCFCKSCSRIQRWPALCATLCLFMLIPAVFWIAGGVFFPLGVVFSDTCASIENVSWKFARGSTDWLCQSTLGGVWLGSGNCELDMGPLAEGPVTVNLNNMLEALLRGCDTHPGEFRKFYTDVAAVFSSVPKTTVDRTMDNFGTLCSPHPEAEHAIREAARFLPNNIDAMLDDLSNTFNCESIQPSIVQFRDTLCCDFGDALLYQILSWYLIGIWLCCCGLPASILGIKRFPNQLWGPDYERNITFQPEFIKEHWKAQPELTPPPSVTEDYGPNENDELPWRLHADEEASDDEEPLLEPSSIVGGVEAIADADTGHGPSSALGVTAPEAIVEEGSAGRRTSQVSAARLARATASAGLVPDSDSHSESPRSDRLHSARHSGSQEEALPFLQQATGASRLSNSSLPQDEGLLEPMDLGEYKASRQSEHGALRHSRSSGSHRSSGGESKADGGPRLREATLDVEEETGVPA